MRLGILFGALALALALAILTLQTPRPLSADTPAADFSAARAMADVRQIARAPHPVGSAEHARVRAYLTARMTALGLQTTTQTGGLSPDALRRLAQVAGSDATEGSATNLIGVLPGSDPAAPAVVLMAHYDSVAGSPGAADDASGVAAALEAVRAIQARGPARRPLILLLTDAEELNLDGARLFFSEHPLRDRVAAVVNMEARGGGGRAMMFETGRGNAETVALFARAAGRATGGATSNSLAVFVYERMPNGTDFTIPKNRGIQGLNFAFIGRPAQYHSPASTPEALDQGSVQHIGSQALEATNALLRAPALPRAGADAVYSDIFGMAVIRHPPVVGWGLLALTGGLLALAAWRARRVGAFSFRDPGRGVLDGLWLLSTGMVAAHAARVLAGPMLGRIESADAYYTLLRRLPWMEAGAALAVAGVALVVLAGRARADRRWVVGVTVAAALLALILGGPSPLVIGAAAISIGLGLWRRSAPDSPWGGWLRLIGLIGFVGLMAQAAAPEAAFLFIWTALLAAVAAAVTALIDPWLARPGALTPSAVATVVGGAWLIGLAHAVYLGVGMDLPGVLALIALLVLMLARPLAPQGSTKALLVTAAACLLLAVGVSAAAKLTEPMAPMQGPL
jgi:hypothetical protein